jgi:hypothetical protein
MGCMLYAEPCHHTALAGVGDKPGRHAAQRAPMREGPPHASDVPLACRRGSRTTTLVKERSPSDQIHREGARPRASSRPPGRLLVATVKLPQRPGAVDRGAWPIAAPLERVAELLRVDPADVTEAAQRVAPYVTADGQRLWSVKLIERAIDPDARPWLGRRLGAAAKTPPTLAG